MTVFCENFIKRVMCQVNSYRHYRISLSFFHLCRLSGSINEYFLVEATLIRMSVCISLFVWSMINGHVWTLLCTKRSGYKSASETCLHIDSNGYIVDVIKLNSNNKRRVAKTCVQITWKRSFICGIIFICISWLLS